MVLTISRLKDFQRMEDSPYSQRSEELGLCEKSISGHVWQARRDLLYVQYLVQGRVPRDKIPEWFKKAEGNLQGTLRYLHLTCQVQVGTPYL